MFPTIWEVTWGWFLFVRGAHPKPPTGRFFMITEDGNNIITESGDDVVTDVF